MDENPFKNKSPKPDTPQGSAQEKLDVRVEIATEKDWETYKAIHLLAINGKDAEMFGITLGNIEKKREEAENNQKYKEDLENNEVIVFLLWQGNESIGIIRAKKREEEGVWYLSYAYVKEDSRGKAFSRKIFSEILNEIKKQGAIKVLMGVKVKNKKMIRLATLLGFKKVEADSSDEGFYMELYLEK